MTAEEAEQKRLFDIIRRRQEARERGEEYEEDDGLGPADQLHAELGLEYHPDAKHKFLPFLSVIKVPPPGKAPTKPPKPLRPTKVNLELALDQEKAFSSSMPISKRTADEEAAERGVVLIHESSSGDESEQQPDLAEVLEPSYEEESIAGVSWQDLQILCGDWSHLNPPSKRSSPEPEIEMPPDPDDIFGEIEARPAKKQKLENFAERYLSIPQFELPPFEDALLEAQKVARMVVLDMNDPHLLLDVQDTAHAEAKPLQGLRNMSNRDSRGSLAKRLHQRFNLSNDEAYDLLKENHQSKVRSQISSVVVEHGMPAARLQYPFYKTRLGRQESRAFHRPIMSFGGGHITFNKLKQSKRKQMRGKPAQEIFNRSIDLSLGDNSSALLLEYSEEYPMMLSNFGMGSKVVNYYRRKDVEDTSRPKQDMGETQLLMPQDKSPFSTFGTIEPGETTPAIQNTMYKAPIFEQDAKSTDFLFIRSSTGVEGQQFFLRNIDNLRVVGQQFPNVDIPGPHSRKVTTAAKNRLKMISFRRLKRNKPHRVTVPEITRHFPDTTDMQNRQKLKEFMQYSKEHKEWEMKPGEPIPEEDVLRSYVKPEDVCLLESMQVGQQKLHDAGYGKDEDGDDDGEKEGQSIEQQLAPWYLSRNFLNAAQGKAMLELQGEGDPTKNGEGFSFVKISMKGGFRDKGESASSSQARLDLQKKNGHNYNVAEQQKAYEQTIQRIWVKQKAGLSNREEGVSDDEMDIDDDEDDRELRTGTPRPGAHDYGSTPGHLIDENASVMTGRSLGSMRDETLTINRWVKDSYGNEKLETEVIRDSKIAKAYLKRRREQDIENVEYAEPLRKRQRKNAKNPEQHRQSTAHRRPRKGRASNTTV